MFSTGNKKFFSVRALTQETEVYLSLNVTATGSDVSLLWNREHDNDW